ncbi:hypothetical protein L195_g057850, partial [Trifolium pratense]
MRASLSGDMLLVADNKSYEVPELYQRCNDEKE